MKQEANQKIKSGNWKSPSTQAQAVGLFSFIIFSCTYYKKIQVNDRT